MFKKIILNFLLSILFIFSVNSDSIFNSIYWIKDYTVNNITLYSNRDKENKLNFYKAEIVLDNVLGEQFYNNLIDFDKYQKIFPKIFLTKKVNTEDGNKNSGIYYFLLNFSPLQNRDYHVNLKYYIDILSSTKKYVVEWWPVTELKELYEVNTKYLYVKLIYGRWQIIEKDGKVKISIEYYNDFEVGGPKDIRYKIEKAITVNALKDLIRYTLAKK